MKLLSKGIFKIFALVTMLCVVGSVFATSTLSETCGTKGIDKHVVITTANKTIITTSFKDGSRLVYTISKDYSKMEIKVLNKLISKKYIIYVSKIKNGKYKVLLYDGKTLKQSLIMDRNPIKLMMTKNIGIKDINPINTEISISLSGNPVGRVGDRDYLTVSVNYQCVVPVFVMRQHYVRLPEGVEYLWGWDTSHDYLHGYSIIHLDSGEYIDLPYNMGRVYGPCTLLHYFDGRFLFDVSDTKQVNIEYTSSGDKIINAKSQIILTYYQNVYCTDEASVLKTIK